MPIRITAKRDGFRRAGINHSGTPTTYDDEHFSARQLAQLKAEPMLVVEVIASTTQELPPTYRIPDTSDELLALQGEVKQRLLLLGVELEPQPPTLESLIEQADFATLRDLRHTLNVHLVGSGEVPELLALRDDITQELEARGYTAPVVNADSDGVNGGDTGTDAPVDTTADGNADVKPTKTPVKPALKPGKGK
ncbi:hypothetical protein H8I91_21560 [Serratia fonticola]|uniref:HI1506-related protein n=1 Tax=Serratia fonticola TaxID=47917 RepID=UPI00164498C0|nr:HI1506-related protein [Serratia fonticola]MBC3252856.1 hypothetical protein [Serratia fonticola]